MLAWRLWKSMIIRCLCFNQATYHLRIKLGLWIPQVQKHQECSYHMDMINRRRLIKQTKKEGIYLVHSRCQSESIYFLTYSITLLCMALLVLKSSINTQEVGGII